MGDSEMIGGRYLGGGGGYTSGMEWSICFFRLEPMLQQRKEKEGDKQWSDIIMTNIYILVLIFMLTS